MQSSFPRYALVLFLIAAAGAAEAVLGFSARPTPALPTVSALTAGTGWRIAAASGGDDAELVFRQWLLRDPAGHQALLYLGASRMPQPMLTWSGELGYQGDGYTVVTRGRRQLRLSQGDTVTVANATVEWLADRRYLEYAVVDRDGVAAHGADQLPGVAWDLLRGDSATYYLVRVSVPAGASGDDATGSAERLLSGVVPKLLRLARATGG